MHDRSFAIVALALSAASLSCRGRSVSRAPIESLLAVAAPSDDRGDLCADVSDLRVCWSGDGAAPAIVHRALPAIASPSPLGWRCTGRGAARTCVDRARGVGTFVCDDSHANGASCTQSHPRVPDDGEWTCADAEGSTVCVGSESPAGVLVGRADEGWICGDRRAHARGAHDVGGRVCVDLAPDFPDGTAVAWRCRFEHDRGMTRVCVRDTTAHVLGDVCDAARPCVDSAACVASELGSSRCIPGRPVPACWLDSDCAPGACRFGACVGAPS